MSILFTSLTSCTMRAVEDDYNMDSPSYKTLQLNSGKTILAKTRFFWVKNYRNRSDKLNELATKIMCGSIRDTVEIDRITLLFARGGSQWDIEYLKEYRWSVERPKIMSQGTFQPEIPLQCK